jgi:predicted N-formylglutamate amidohydrolase
MTANAGDSAPLLQVGDPAPVEIVNAASAASTLLLCDHAGRAIPKRLGDLGVQAAAFERHVAWDIGALDVARRLSASLDAPLIHSVYSRLVLDVNRRPDNVTAIAEVSDDIPVPANRGLSAAARQARFAALHEPYHAAVAARLALIRDRGEVPALISIHSFTPVFQGFVRPWQVGILWNRDARLARPLIAALTAMGLTVGDNQPYSGQDGHGYTMPRHGEATGFPHALFEIRQDLIATGKGAAEWAERLTGILRPLLADATLRSAKV